MKNITAVIILTPFLFFNCANYVNQVHDEISRADSNSQRPAQPGIDSAYYDMYRRVPHGKDKDRRPIQSPKTYSLHSTRDKHDPNIVRSYSNAKKRYSANDFVDQDTSSSLWTNEHGMTTDLFIANERKKVGDLIVVGVMDNLKREISNELKRAFPEKRKDNKEDEKTKEENKNERSTAGSADVYKPDDKPEANRVWDKISSQVAEEISNDYILLKGQKEVIFRGAKRLVEVQALVARKDITTESEVPSDKILESRVYILR